MSGKGSEERARQIANELNEQIASGEFRKGAMLPGTLWLMKKHKAGQKTVNRARAILVERGLVKVVIAKGTFVL